MRYANQVASAAHVEVIHHISSDLHYFMAPVEARVSLPITNQPLYAKGSSCLSSIMHSFVLDKSPSLILLVWSSLCGNVGLVWWSTHSKAYSRTSATLKVNFIEVCRLFALWHSFTQHQKISHLNTPEHTLTISCMTLFERTLSTQSFSTSGGCRRIPYTPICASGPNGAILHYGRFFVWIWATPSCTSQYGDRLCALHYSFPRLCCDHLGL